MYTYVYGIQWKDQLIDVPIINDMNVDLSAPRSLARSLARSLVIRDLMSPVRRVEPDKTVNDG